MLREKQPQKGKESVWIATVDQVPACQPVYLRDAGGIGPDLILTAEIVICNGAPTSTNTPTCKHLNDIYARVKVLLKAAQAPFSYVWSKTERVL